MATVEVTKEDLREIKEMLAGLATKEELTEHFQHLLGETRQAFELVERHV